MDDATIDERPSWRRGLFGDSRTSRRSRLQRGRSTASLALHRLGAASAHASAGAIAAAALVLWTIVGALVGFAAWWENVLYIVSSTVTLVMLFALQHTQSRQQAAVQLKLDELIRALPRADERLIAVEEAPDQELEVLTEQSLEDREVALDADGRVGLS